MKEEIVVTYLGNLREKVLSKERLQKLIRDAMHTKQPGRVLVSLRRNGWIRYVFKGHYYILDPEERYNNTTQYSAQEMLFVVLNKLKIAWYLGLESALEYQSVVWQGHNRIIILNTSVSGTRRIQNTAIQFRKMKKDYFFGTKRFETKNRIRGHYSDKEKTIADYAYYGRKAPLELFQGYDNSRAHDYLRHYSPRVREQAFP